MRICASRCTCVTHPQRCSACATSSSACRKMRKHNIGVSRKIKCLPDVRNQHLLHFSLSLFKSVVLKLFDVIQCELSVQLSYMFWSLN